MCLATKSEGSRDGSKYYRHQQRNYRDKNMLNMEFRLYVFVLVSMLQKIHRVNSSKNSFSCFLRFKDFFL